MDESSWCSTSSLAFGVSVPDFGYFNRCVMVSLCCFNFNFLDDMIWSIFSYAYLLSVYIYLWWGIHKIFGPFLIGFVFYFWDLYILDNSLLSVVSFAKICCQFMIMSPILLTLSFAECKVLQLIKFSLSIISFMSHSFGIVYKRSSPNPRPCNFFLCYHLGVL